MRLKTFLRWWFPNKRHICSSKSKNKVKDQLMKHPKVKAFYVTPSLTLWSKERKALGKWLHNRRSRLASQQKARQRSSFEFSAVHIPRHHAVKSSLCMINNWGSFQLSVNAEALSTVSVGVFFLRRLNETGKNEISKRFSVHYSSRGSAQCCHWHISGPKNKQYVEVKVALLKALLQYLL